MQCHGRTVGGSKRPSPCHRPPQVLPQFLTSTPSGRAVALLGELQRLQGKDHLVQRLLDQVVSLLAAPRSDDEADADG